jgi:hypothetical protein
MKWVTLVFAVIVATLLVGLAARPVLAASIPSATAVVTVKDFQFVPAAQIFENPVGLAIDRKGDILTGILFTGEVVKVTPEGKSSRFASLPAVAADLEPCRQARPGADPGQEPAPFMTAFALHRSGDLYVGLPNCDPDTHGIWRVHPDGSAEPFASVPLSQLPRDLAFRKNGDFPLYVTDLHDFTRSREECEAALGTPDACTLKIWSIDQNGHVDDWKESTLFYGNPDSTLPHPHGVNGIVVDEAGENVYVTITDHGRVMRIPINPDGSAGEAKIIFESPIPPNSADPRYWGMAGMTIGPDGNLYILITRTDELVALPADLPACTDSPTPTPCNESSIKVLHQGHPVDGPNHLTFSKGKADAGKHGKADLPPLYITNGGGTRVFFYNVALSLGQGSLLSGVPQIVGLIAANQQLDQTQAEEYTISIQPRPSLVRVLLSTGTTGGSGD